jgi:hypothetical protein
LRFEREQSQFMDETVIKRQYLLKKLKIKDQNMSDEELLKALIEEKEKLYMKYSLLNTIVPEQDF